MLRIDLPSPLPLPDYLSAIYSSLFDFPDSPSSLTRATVSLHSTGSSPRYIITLDLFSSPDTFTRIRSFLCFKSPSSSSIVTTL